MGHVSATRLFATSLTLALTIATIACGGSSHSSSSTTPGASSGSSATAPTSGSTSSTGTTSSGGTSGTTSGSGSSGSSGSGGSGGSGSGGSGSGGSGSGGGAASATESLYVLETANTSDNAAASVVEGFAINSDGTLSSAAKVNAGNGQGDILADSASQYLFAGTANLNSGPGGNAQITSYTIDGAGKFTVVATDAIAGRDTISSLLLDSSGSDLYVSFQEVMIEGQISTYAVNRSSGKFSSSSPDATVNNGMPGKLMMHPSGNYVYAALDIQHHAYEMGGWDLLLRDPATGALTDTNRQFNAPNGFNVFTDAAFTKGGAFLVSVAASYNLITFGVDTANGNLTYLNNTAGDFNGIATDSTGNFIIVTHQSGTVESYMVSANGSLTLVNSVMAAAGITYVAIDKANKYAFVESPNTSQIFALTFDATTGKLGTGVSGSPFATSSAPIHLTTAAK